jgi:ubiquitin-protein ligase
MNYVEKQISEYYRLSESGEIPHITGEWIFNGKLMGIELLAPEDSLYEGIKLHTNIVIYDNRYEIIFDPPIIHPNVGLSEGKLCFELGFTQPISIILRGNSQSVILS